MKNNFYKKIIGLALLGALSIGCTDDLNTEPKYELTLEQLLQQDPNAIDGMLSKMYSTFALSSVNGAGSSDIAGADPGESPFVRGLINLQDFTADGMKNRWGDGGLDPLTTTSNWSANNKFFKYMYDRIYYTVPQTTNLILILKNRVEVSNEDQYISELRFLRALSYYYLIDLFGKGPLVNDDTFGSSAPLPESNRQQLFDFVEAELLDIENKIAPSNTYGRANAATVQMLLAKIYLNAEVYTGTARYAEAATYASKVIAGGYQLETNFRKNFATDNNTSKEIIFPLIADAVNSQSFGNTTYIIQGSIGAQTMNPANYGAVNPPDGAWSGHRATKAWYGLFGNSAADLAASTDVRAKLFWTTGHNWEMNDYKEWTDGYPSVKFTNLSSTGTGTPSVFVSTDFPLFRLADALLIYSECAARNASGASMAQGLTYFNQVRTRSGASAFPSYTLQNVLDERGREFGLEGVRRQDLIRFGKFTGGSYLWPWKGGVKDGTSISDNYKVFPIPTTALQANPNLTPNPGY